MYPQQGKSIYNNIYNNNYQNNQNNQNAFIRKNQAIFNNQNNNNNNPNNKNQSNLKYADLEIQAFFNDGGNQNISAKDLQLTTKLENMTKQYMSIFDNINGMASKISGGNSNINKLNEFKKQMEEIDSYNATEYGNYLNELFDISKDGTILNIDYKKYKQNPKDSDEKLKKVISNFKYDVVLHANQHNSQENIKKLKNYIEDKKEVNNNSNNNNYNNNNFGNESKSAVQFNYGNSIYGNKNQENKDSHQYGFGSNIYSNQNSNMNKKYENPNAIGNGDIYGNENNNYRNKSIYENNYNPNQYEPQSYNDKITVNLIYQGKNYPREYNSNESGELLYYAALEIKDDPKIYDINGNVIFYEAIKEMKIKDIFKDIEPTLKIY